MDQISGQHGNYITRQKKCEKRYFPRLHQSVTCIKKELFANVRGYFCDHNTELAKIAMITYHNTKTRQRRNREKCYCSNKKKVTKKNRKSKCPENLALNKKIY
jgi:hypothetical protein